MPLAKTVKLEAWPRRGREGGAANGGWWPGEGRGKPLFYPHFLRIIALESSDAGLPLLETNNKIFPLLTQKVTFSVKSYFYRQKACLYCCLSFSPGIANRPRSLGSGLSISACIWSSAVDRLKSNQQKL